MAHERREQLERNGVRAHPVGEGATEIVGGDLLDLGASAGGLEVVAHVAPGGEQAPARALGVLLHDLEQRALAVGEDDHGALAPLGLGAPDGHALGVGEIASLGVLALAPGSGRGQDKGDARRPVRQELCEQARSLVSGQGALPRLVVRGEGDGEQAVDLPAPEPRALGELEGGAQGHELLADRVVAGVLAPAHGDEPVDVAGREPVKREGPVVARLVVLEHADPVAGLGAVEADGGDASALGASLLLARLEEQSESVAYRRLARGCVIGIGGVAFVFAGDGLRSLLVVASGRFLDPTPILVDVAVIDAPALEDPHPNTSVA